MFLEDLEKTSSNSFTKFSNHVGLSIVDSLVRVLGKAMFIDFWESITFFTSCGEMKKLLLEFFLSFSFSLFSFILSWSSWTSFGERDFSVTLCPWKLKEILLVRPL